MESKEVLDTVYRDLIFLYSSNIPGWAMQGRVMEIIEFIHKHNETQCYTPGEQYTDECD